MRIHQSILKQHLFFRSIFCKSENHLSHIRPDVPLETSDERVLGEVSIKVVRVLTRVLAIASVVIGRVDCHHDLIG